LISQLDEMLVDPTASVCIAVEASNASLSKDTSENIAHKATNAVRGKNLQVKKSPNEDMLKRKLSQTSSASSMPR
jgi:hypothetical protein